MSRAFVRIREVGPREGLQCDPQVVETRTKVDLIELLLAAGVRELNAVSLVSPKAMPQMADAEQVLELVDTTGCEVSALVPNQRGLDRAVALRARGLLDRALFVHATTEPVLRANGINLNLADNLRVVLEMAGQAHDAGMTTSVFVSAAFGCSIEGAVEDRAVLDPVEVLAEAPAVDEIVVSDSTGQADPAQVRRLLAKVASIVGEKPVGLHFHDSRGAGSANVVAAVESEIRNLCLDTAFGGLGGDIPFLPEAAGNIATEDTCEMLHGMGVATGVDVEKVRAATSVFKRRTGRQVHSKVFVMGSVKWKMAPPFPTAR